MVPICQLGFTKVQREQCRSDMSVTLPSVSENPAVSWWCWFWTVTYGRVWVGKCSGFSTREFSHLLMASVAQTAQVSRLVEPLGADDSVCSCPFVTKSTYTQRISKSYTPFRKLTLQTHLNTNRTVQILHKGPPWNVTKTTKWTARLLRFPNN